MKLYIKYMVSQRCKIVVSEALKRMNIDHALVDLGTIEIPQEINTEQINQLATILSQSGLELMEDKKNILVEKIKNTVIDIIHHSEELPKTNYSTYISEKLQYDYTYLANIFSEVKGMTLQQYIILHKIERVKELLLYNELNLSEIAFKMHYSSVAHLSNQFKKITGLSPSYYKQLKEKRKGSLENL
ncbi:helix-turn-helix domain-containing protein [Penaeicola halotolerans]|uniref:helix-turn-helix domain-containing protein n=1 Tax=Penaeicola halotolerans TaxID=2793196 RepID=UPI001CF8EAD9|nr:AraC family transcriptional regulator [Penaeicola halotolerans]